jgi:MerR family transcriptional regulator, gold-responsive activator of gol and ges genes
MIRYYEATGLIRPAERSSSNYRDYSENDVHELKFIRRARDLGFSVAEIGELLDLWRDRNRQSGDVRQFVRDHLDRLQEKIVQLQAMAQTLNALAEQCAGDDRPECPIIHSLEGARGRSGV